METIKNKMHILLTRQLEDCSDLIFRFKELGHIVSHLPLLVIEKVNYDQKKLNDCKSIIFTSANAIKFLETKNIDKNIKCFCVGLATEKKAKSVGFQNIIAAEGNVRNLKELILQNFDPSDGEIIYVSGEIISSDLDQQLINDGYSVKRLINYKTNHNKIYDDNFVEKLKVNIPNIVYIYSYNSALSFLNFIKNENLQSFWMETNLMCMGEKTSSILNEIFLVFLIFRGIISKLIIKKLELISKKTTNKLDDTFVSSLVGPARFFPIVIGFFIASYYMSFSSEGREIVDTINRTLITILIFWIIHQIIEPISYVLSGLDQLLTRELIGWIIKSLKILIFILGLAAVLELWGIKIGPIIAGLGLFGVAVALGAQDLFKNLISGILVLVEKRFKIGDWISVDGVIEGIVEKIGFRSTSIRKFDKSLAIIPNFQFAENAVTNVSETSNWRIRWAITLQYDTTIDQLKKIRDEIEAYINKSEDFNQSAGVAVRIEKFSDSSIDLLVRCFTKSNSWNDWLEVKERLAIEIKQIVEGNKASFAFPSQSIYIEKK